MRSVGTGGHTSKDRAATVLLVEDDHDVREALGAALAGEGLSVLASDEGRKALELAEISRPSVILLDLRMSGMSGWEFLEKRRSVPALARTPVVVMTGAQEPLPDADVVLHKPFGIDELLQVVRRLLGRK